MRAKSRRHFGQGQKTRILDGRCAMTETGEIAIVAGEGEEGRDACLPDLHRHVPSLVGGTDQEWPTRAEKQDIAPLSRK